VSCYCEHLVAEAGDSSGNRRKRNVGRQKPLPNNGFEDSKRLRNLSMPYNDL
jgi:hypothetical protein